MSDYEKGLPRKFICQQHRGTIMSGDAVHRVDQMSDFKIRDSDIWVCSFPRSGTTLLQEMTFLVKTLDFELAKTKHMQDRFPYIDDSYFGDLEAIEKKQSPRMIQSHFHFSLLPDGIKKGKGKVIYITRNPKSSVVSLYKYHDYYNSQVASTLREFIELFLDDKVFCCPWWRHVRQFWEHRNDDTVLFLKYEDIIKDKKLVLSRIAEFLNCELSDNDINKICEHTKIENMRVNKMVNYEVHGVDMTNRAFINTGTVDGWKDVIPEDLQRRIDAMVKDKLGDTDLTFA